MKNHEILKIHLTKYMHHLYAENLKMFVRKINGYHHK